MQEYRERRKREREELGKLKADMDEEKPPERKHKKEEPSMAMKLLGIG